MHRFRLDKKQRIREDLQSLRTTERRDVFPYAMYKISSLEQALPGGLTLRGRQEQIGFRRPSCLSSSTSIKGSGLCPPRETTFTVYIAVYWPHKSLNVPSCCKVYAHNGIPWTWMRFWKIDKFCMGLVCSIYVGLFGMQFESCKFPICLRVWL